MRDSQNRRIGQAAASLHGERRPVRVEPVAWMMEDGTVVWTMPQSGQQGVPMEYVEPMYAEDEAYDYDEADLPEESIEGVAPASKATKAPKAERPPAVRRVAWWMSMVTMGVVVGLIVVGFMKIINDPVQATGSKTATQSKAAAIAAPNDNQLAGLAFSLSYPGVFDQVSQVKNDKQAQEQYNMGSESNPKRFIAVEVRPMVSGGVEGDSSYRFRQLKPDTYTSKTEIIGGQTVYFMTKNDKQEQTMFWPHKDIFITVSITSTDSKDDVVKYMETVKKSLKWRT